MSRVMSEKDIDKYLKYIEHENNNQNYEEDDVSSVIEQIIYNNFLQRGEE